MNTPSKKRSRKEQQELDLEIRTLSLEIADAKERLRWNRVEVEKCATLVRETRRRIQGWKLLVIGLPDPNERSKMNADLTSLEKKVEDYSYQLAELRSKVRRGSKSNQDLEDRLVRVRNALKMPT